MIKYEYECPDHGRFESTIHAKRVHCPEKDCTKRGVRRYSTFGVNIK